MVSQKNSQRQKAIKSKVVETESFIPTPDDFVKWFYILVRECGGHISISKSSPMPKKLVMEFTHGGDIINCDIPEMRKKKKKSKIIVPDDSIIVPDKSITFPRITKGQDHGG